MRHSLYEPYLLLVYPSSMAAIVASTPRAVVGSSAVRACADVSAVLLSVLCLCAGAWAGRGPRAWAWAWRQAWAGCGVLVWAGVEAAWTWAWSRVWTWAWTRGVGAGSREGSVSSL